MELMEVETIKGEIQPVVAEGEALAKRIVDFESYKEGSEYLKRNKAAAAIVEAKLGPIREAQYSAWKKTVALIKEVITPLESGSGLVSRAMTAWKAEDDRQKRIEAEKVAAEARKRDEDARLQAAAEAEKSGQKDVAEAILNDPTPPPMPVMPKPARAEGTFQRTTWKARVTNFRLLVAAVNNGTVPQGAVIEDMAFLNGQARLMKENMRYPGVEVYAETSTNVR